MAKTLKTIKDKDLKSTATIRNFTFPMAFGRGPTMSIPHWMKGYAAVTEVISCLGIRDTDFFGYGILILDPLWSLVKCRHRYAVSSLMDTAYWMSE
nr:hypothetical protein [Tanacetum cinerariifolium]